MKKLEDIPKKQSFIVPDGYFEDLPMRIQSRIQSTEKKTVWIPDFSLALKYALPAVLVGIISLLVWTKTSQSEDSIANLDSVPTEHLLAYLEAEEITTEEIIENASFSTSTINTLYSAEEEVPSDALNEVAQQFDFNF